MLGRTALHPVQVSTHNACVTLFQCPRGSRTTRRLQSGLDSVLVAEIELEGMEARDVAGVVAARAVEICGRDAVVFRVQRGSVEFLASTMTTTPNWVDHQTDVLAALRDRATVIGARTVLPIRSGSRCDAVLSVEHGRGSLDQVELILLRLLTWQAGAAFERCERATERLHSLDNVSGVSGLMASLQPGDVLAVVRVDGDDLAVQRLGVQLWERVRADDRVARVGADELALVLRQVHGSVEQVLRKVAGPELQRSADVPFQAGAALHLPHRAPMETIEAAREALVAAGEAHVLMAIASEAR